jgi:iron complex outermembrane receptor protein
MNRKKHLSTLLSLALLAPMAYAAPVSPDDIDQPLEELMSVVVTSASKKEQSLAETAAAAYVITADDISRSGASNIPEALRLAPGVQVSAIGNNKWSVSIRGFADRFANKLLVLVDGRSVYEPLFSGVLWEALDIPLENIARIEVIRGPGASIWGANAVNGVINIITKSPFDIQGGKVSVATGSELKGYGLARYGWSPNPDTGVALYAKAHYYAPAERVGGGENNDNWQSQTAGFKVERLLERGTLHVQGDVSKTHAGDEVSMISAPPAMALTQSTEKVSAGNLMARWEAQAGEDRQDSLQFYLDHSNYDNVTLSQRRTTANLEYQQRRKLGDRHDLIWGLGYRHNDVHVGISPLFTINNADNRMSLYSVYAQDEITLQPERWRLSLGARLDHNDYTGFEFQPNLRLMWTPDERNSVWLSLAKAMRTPSVAERGATVNVYANPAGAPPFVPPSLVQSVSGDQQDEKLNALDLGWRHQFTPKTSLDLAAFYYRYDRLRGASTAAPQPVWLSGMPGVPTAFPDYVLIQTQPNNANSADVSGLEASLDWRPTTAWRLQGNYSWLLYRVHTADSPNQVPSDYTDVSPTNQVSLRSSLDLSHNLRWDAWLRHVSRIKSYGIPAFTTLDMRLAWQAGKDLEIALVGQNLLDKVHPEFATQYFVSTPSEIERSAYVKVDWKF